MGFDTESHASQIYWLDKTKVSVESNIKFNEDMTHLISATQPTDTHVNLATGTAGANTGDTGPTQSPPRQMDELTDPPSVATDQCTKSNQVPTGATEGRSTRSKKPSQYIQWICTGEGTATGVMGDTTLPPGMPAAMTAEITDADLRGDDYAMAICIKARVEPKNEAEACTSPDWPHLEEDMRCEIGEL